MTENNIEKKERAFLEATLQRKMKMFLEHGIDSAISESDFECFARACVALGDVARSTTDPEISWSETGQLLRLTYYNFNPEVFREDELWGMYESMSKITSNWIKENHLYGRDLYKDKTLVASWKVMTVLEKGLLDRQSSHA